MHIIEYTALRSLRIDKQTGQKDQAISFGLYMSVEFEQNQQTFGEEPHIQSTYAQVIHWRWMHVNCS